MSNTPLVTIGLPVYNSEKYLQHSLNSLLSQTYSGFVLIISDNASTDGTSEICKCAAASDPRVRYFRNEVNIGNPGNFNRVFQLTETKYLKWSTSDDYWDSTFLEKAIPVMEADESIALCYPKSYVVEGDDAEPKPYEDNLNLMQEDPAVRFLTLINTIGLAHQHLGVIRTSMLRQTHLLRPEVGSDIAFLAELALYGKFYEYPERLFYRRFHPKSGSWKRLDVSHQAERYQAANAKRMRLLKWHRLGAFYSDIHSSPLSVWSKLNVYRKLTRGAIMSRDELIDELKDAWKMRGT